MLTDATIRAAAPGDRTIKLSDAEGLQLHVHPNGSRLWRLAYRFHRKQRTLALGRYPEVGLREARRRRSIAKAHLAEGRDPSAEKKRQSPKGAPTWAEVVADYIDVQRKRGRAPKTLAKIESQAAHTVRAFGDRPVAEVRASDILPVLRALEESGKHTTAVATRALCSRIFRFAVSTDRAESDPAASLVGALIGVRSEGYPAIIDRDGIGALLRAVDGYAGEPMTRTGLLLCAYTFLRPGEVAGLHWSDVDFEAATITIPAERMKLPRPHVVPLSRQVVGFLREIHCWTGRSTHVLWSLRTADRPLSNNTLNAALRRLGYTKAEMVAHGFRKIASTLLNEEGWNADWIERQLAHVERNKVRAAYDKSEHLEGRRKMMQAYADMLDKLAAPVR